MCRLTATFSFKGIPKRESMRSLKERFFSCFFFCSIVCFWFFLTNLISKHNISLDGVKVL